LGPFAVVIDAILYIISNYNKWKAFQQRYQGEVLRV